MTLSGEGKKLWAEKKNVNLGVGNKELYRNKKLLMERMAAFTLYLEKGMEAVKRMYPQHISFVKSRKGKSQAEVKKELLHAQTA